MKKITAWCIASAVLLLTAFAQTTPLNNVRITGTFNGTPTGGTFDFSNMTLLGLPTSSGTVTSFSSGNLSPLFTSSVATATTTPALTFTLSTQTANTVLAGPTTGSAAVPTFRALVIADLPPITFGYLTSTPTTLSGYGISDAQPLDADLTALAALTGTDTIYYRSGVSTWSPVTIGANLTFSGGTLNASASGSGTVTSVSVTTANGVSGTVATATTTPAITLTLGAITPTSVAASGAVTGSNLSGTNTGDNAANSSSVAVNAPITGATKTKVTYDSKGLVTAGADATTADIADSLNARYVTDAQLTVIGNTSGTNTGDNSPNSSYSNVTNDAQTKAAIVPNTVPAAGQILVGNAGGTAYGVVSMSGHGTLASTGALTLATTTVTPGSYTNANITVDAYGRLTAASNGSGGGGTPGGSTTEVQYNNAGAFGGITGATTDGTNMTFGSGNLRATSPLITTGLLDSNGNELFLFTATASAVNELTIANAATGAGPTISATGSDADISINFATKGTGDFIFTAPSTQTLEMKFDTAGGTGATILQLQSAGTAKFLAAVPGANAQIVNDSTAGDGVLRTQGGAFRVTTDSGTSTGLLVVASTGQVSAEKTTASTSTTTGALISKGGLGVAGAGWFGSTINAPAATTSIASLNMPHGTAPSAPTNGDLWTTTAGLYAQINGSTVGPFGTGGGTPGGSDTQVQFNDGGAFGGDAGFVYNKTTNTATIGVVATEYLNAANNTGVFQLIAAATPVNGLTATNAAASASPVIGTAGTDATIDLTLTPKVASGATSTVKVLAGTGAHSRLLVDATTASEKISYIAFARGGSAQGYVGVNGITGGTGFITGAAIGSLNLRAETNEINFSVDAGSSIGLQLNSSGTLVTKATATGAAGLRLPHGTAPSSPTNGDLWTTTAGLYAQINGATVGPFGTGGGGDMLLGTAQTVTAAKTFNAGTLKIASGGDVVDANGNELIKFTATASAVNELTITNFSTGGYPRIAGTGDDANVGIIFEAKGNEAMYINGTNPGLLFQRSGTAKGQMGIAAATDGIITGSALDDMAFRNRASGAFLFSTDNGASAAFKIAGTSGNVSSIAPASTHNPFEISTTTALWLPYILMKIAGTQHLGFGVAADSNQFMPGTVAGDVGLNASSGGSFMLSTSSTPSVAFKVYGTTGQVSAEKTTASTSTTTGALISKGGLGVAGAIWAGSTINAPAATTSIASLNMPHGTAPSAPTNGDLWTTTAGLYARINGSTVGPFGVGTLTASSTDTLTNKRITARTSSQTSSATWSPDVSTTDIFIVTAQAADASTINNPSGTPTEGQKLIIRVKDNGTSRALTWSGTQWRASTDLPLPTSTTVSKTLYMGFIYNSTDTKWDLIFKLDNF